MLAAAGHRVVRVTDLQLKDRAVTAERFGRLLSSRAS